MTLKWQGYIYLVIYCWLLIPLDNFFLYKEQAGGSQCCLVSLSLRTSATSPYFLTLFDGHLRCTKIPFENGYSFLDKIHSELC